MCLNCIRYLLFTHTINIMSYDCNVYNLIIERRPQNDEMKKVFLENIEYIRQSKINK